MPTFHRRCQSWVGSSLHSVRKSSSYLLGGLLLCTPLRLPFPRSGGAAFLVFWLDFNRRDWLFANSVCGYGELVSFFPRVVRRISSVPAVLSFVEFSTSVAFWLGWFIGVGNAVLCFSFVVTIFS